MKFNLSFYLTDNDEIGTISVAATEAFGEKGQYTLEEVAELRRIHDVSPRPDFSQITGIDKDLRKQDLLIEYSNSIREKLNNSSPSNGAIATEIKYY